ncbi:MAG: histidine phosphatase family protein [Candidatus Dormibacteria bacterium]
MPERAKTSCFLVRHCDVENPQRILYGHLPGFGLSQKGRRQAVSLGRFLRSFELAVVYRSPLQRAQETCELLAQELVEPPPIEVRGELTEAEFGRYLQGTRYRDVPWRKPRWVAHMAFPGLVPGDESMGTMAARVDRCLQEGLRSHPGRAFACVSHGDPIQAYWATSEGRPPWALHRLQCAKGGLLHLQFADGQLVSKAYLSPQHLEAQASGEGRSDPIEEGSAGSAVSP